MFSVDKYLDKKFDIINYNCWDFLREVFQEYNGVDIKNRTPSTVSKDKLRIAFITQENEFQKINKPEDGCIVLFSRPNQTPHVGFYLQNRVLHLDKNGAKFQPLDICSLGFKNIGFYKCKQSF